MRLCDDYQPEPEHILRPPFDGSGIFFGLGADEWGLFKDIARFDLIDLLFDLCHFLYPGEVFGLFEAIF